MQYNDESKAYEDYKNNGDVIVTINVSIRKGDTDGSAVFENLPRDKYKLVEHENELYQVKSMTVNKVETNCKYDDSVPQAVIFEIGTDSEGKDVIKKERTS